VWLGATFGVAALRESNRPWFAAPVPGGFRSTGPPSVLPGGFFFLFERERWPEVVV
jgi:hypothetical protein